jgi:uncharacterized membrane protein YvbJ
MAKKSFLCSNCGAEVLESSNVCPKCGCIFDEDDNANLSDKAIEHKEKENENTNEEEEKITKTVNSLITLGEIIRWCLVVISIIYFIGGIVAAGAASSYDSTTTNTTSASGFSIMIIAVIMFVTSFFAPLGLDWMAYTLKCLNKISKKR